MPVTLTLLAKMVNMPQYQLKQGTEGLNLVIKDILEMEVTKSPIWLTLKLTTNESHLTIDYQNLNVQIRLSKALISSIRELRIYHTPKEHPSWSMT